MTEVKPLTINVHVRIDKRIKLLMKKAYRSATFRQLLSERFQNIPKFRSVNRQCRFTNGTSELWIILKPANALLEFMATVAI